MCLCMDPREATGMSPAGTWGAWLALRQLPGCELSDTLARTPLSPGGLPGCDGGPSNTRQPRVALGSKSVDPVKAGRQCGRVGVGWGLQNTSCPLPSLWDPR